MGSKVTFDYSKADAFISAHEMESMKKITEAAKAELLGREGAGNDFLGWIDLPVDYDKEEFERIKKAAAKIQSDSEVLVVIGIGGSYLGARAAIEFLGHSFYNVVSKEIRKAPEIYFAGNSISSTYLKHLIEVIGDRDFSVNIISKSGTTTEPAIAFRIFKEKLEKKYGKEEAAKRILDLTKRGSASHSAWLMFMYPRLLLARDLLTNDGVIFISIDDNECHNLKLLCDDVFGEENFVAELTWEKKKKGSYLANDITNIKESVIIYSRKKLFLMDLLEK